MAGTYLNFPFDSEIFNYSWKNTPDLVLTSMINSGAVVDDSEIARLIANGSNFFTTPYYENLGGDEQVYDGDTDFTYDSIAGGTYSGVVYGRMKAWDVISFIKDFNSGADPMEQIVSGVANYWIKARQTRLIGLLDTIFKVTDATEQFATNHTLDIALGTTGTVGEGNKVGATTIADALVKANGDNAGEYSLAILHSKVASDLANLQLLEFSKYTDASGITRNLPIGTINGLTVIVNDLAPSKASTHDVTAKEYTSYLLGQGAIRFASAPVDVPSEMSRNPEIKGGKDMIYTRLRECLAPYGFSFKGNVSSDVGVSDTTLLNPANWERKMPSKSIMMARVISN